MHLIAAPFVVAALAAPPIEYTVRLDAPQTQMVDVRMVVPEVEGETLDVALPAWRPGRYTILDPAGTVREVRAFAGSGDERPIEKVDKTTWRIATGGAATIAIEYRVYANSLADRTRHVDDTHAFLSGESVFLYASGRRGDPVQVHVEAPETWAIATGLRAHPTRPRTVTAPDYDVLVDSPLEIGLHDRLEFDVGGVPHEIVIWPPAAAEYDPEQLTRDFRTIVEHQVSIFGRMPYERYVFQMHVGAGAGGGTEHLNSTIMQTSRRALEDPKAYRRFLGLVAHEFFHTWNVKQLRPAGIHPYDYRRENYTKLLWVAEGTTSYYDDLTLVRTRLIKPKDYLEVLGGAIDRLRRRPGASVQSLEASSFDAWIKFTRPVPDDPNATVSFYSKGALVSLLLDMEIRSRSGHRVSLDDVMRRMFERYPLSGPGYTTEDLRETIESMSGADFAGFFEAYVRGTGPLPFESALATVGLELYLKPKKRDKGDGDQDEDDDEDDDGGDDGDADGDDENAADAAAVPEFEPYIGLRLQDKAGRTVVRTVLADGPAYGAGVMAGDEIVALNGRRLPAGDLDDRLGHLEAGATVELTIFRRDELRTIPVTLLGMPSGKWTLRRVPAPTDEQKTAYESWIGLPWE